jgi:hypothetical protein
VENCLSKRSFRKFSEPDTSGVTSNANSTSGVENTVAAIEDGSIVDNDVGGVLETAALSSESDSDEE